MEPISLLTSTQTIGAKCVRPHSHIVLLMASALIAITMATTFLYSDTETHEGLLWLPVMATNCMLAYALATHG